MDNIFSDRITDVDGEPIDVGISRLAHSIRELLKQRRY